jgi:hypothetical protein
MMIFFGARDVIKNKLQEVLGRATGLFSFHMGYAVA